MQVRFELPVRKFHPPPPHMRWRQAPRLSLPLKSKKAVNFIWYFSLHIPVSWHGAVSVLSVKAIARFGRNHQPKCSDNTIFTSPLKVNDRPLFVTVP